MSKLTLLFFAILFSVSTVVLATEQDELEKMQQQLNQETMSKEFLAEDPEKVEAYIKEAMEKNLKPEEYKGTHWRRGYTCRDLLRYSWDEYRNCSYYYRYHGRYYPYPPY